MPNALELPFVYYKHVAEVKANVPPERLLELDPSNGNNTWKELCDFVSPLSTEIAENCELILQSGLPYPHINARLPMIMVAFVMRAITLLVYWTIPLLVLFLIWRR